MTTIPTTWRHEAQQNRKAARAYIEGKRTSHAKRLPVGCEDCKSPKGCKRCRLSRY